MLFDAVCTVFCRTPEPDTGLEAWRPAVLRGVSWQGEGVLGDRRQPRPGNVTVYIPRAVACRQRYAPPAQFEADPRGRWTLREGDILAPGALEGFHMPPRELGALLWGEAGGMTIVSVCLVGYGSRALQHWEVCGR